MILAIGFASAATLGQGQPPARLFVFDDPFWLNLHHYLYVLGRAHAGLPDSRRRAVAAAPADQAEGLKALDEGEQRAWQAAVAAYSKGPSTRDAIFDGDMVAMGRTLVAAGDKTALDSTGLSAQVVDTLRRAAPLYRKAWWPSHERANQALITRLGSELTKYGTPIHAYILRAYREQWPAEGYPVNVAAYANWAGAFSTSAGVLVVASLDPAAGEGLKGLEGVVSRSHAPVGRRDLLGVVDRSATTTHDRARRTFPRDDLLHSRRGCAQCRAKPRALRRDRKVCGLAAWAISSEPWRLRGKPYLDGHGTREKEAISALVKATAQ